MKCDVCGKPCEMVNMVGINGQTDKTKHEQHDKIKNKEYCDDCFIPVVEKFGLQARPDIQEVEIPQISDQP